ncbi:endo-1,4-beta-xylanase [Planomonospora sp. ID82291]|uniref:endo-1,4-beta-xylanase n=1 Tax=Planomonospora sp. ID82291 TaxID=2738136 RepID=UPI0018C3C3BF|nr:endo-1,4-beta-xylanase [Planomonospora sp. ID82291]MBG0813757.1 endo-1,4-beta-xylanase [Planomonospora sp. ID82291]
MSRLRRALLTGVLAVLPATAVAALPASPAQASSPLRVHAAAHGKFIGTALATAPLANEAAYRTIAATEFNQVTAENAMKWDATEPGPNQFTFTGADQIMAFAEQNDQQVHGHTLVWHNQTPTWVQNLGAAELRAAMQNHIGRVAGRYATNPALTSWDVVNEVFEENGSLRNSFWYQKLGEGYIADAFRYARAADPDARLCINDYNVEGVNAKSTAMYNLVKALRAQNVPVDCVGFQSHLAIQYGFPNIQENMQRFADLGVEVRVTEIDVRMQTPRTSAKDATQATYYSNVVKACLAVSRCSGVTIWGFTDRHSWVPDTFSGQGAALIYDENYGRKPSYTAVHDALAGPPTDPDDTEDPSRPGTPVASAITSSGATLTWTASTDNVRVTGYDVYRGATRLASTTTNSATLTGLAPETAYTVHVVARDAAGNTSAASETTTFTTPAGPGGGTGCTAAYRTVNAWQGGFQGEVKVTCAEPVTSWKTTLTYPAGVNITQNWSSTLSASGTAYTFTNAAWNGALGAGGSATFGFIGTWNGTGAPPAPTLS